MNRKWQKTIETCFLFFCYIVSLVNIWLEILNYKMYTCELEDEDKNVVQRKIISHRTLSTHKGEYIYLKSLNNEIKLDIEK